SETFLSSSLLRWINTDELAGPPLVFKLHDAVDQGEQRVVFTAADIVAGFPTCATLARNDVAAEHSLAAEFLQTEPLLIRVATVLRRLHNADMRFLLLSKATIILVPRICLRPDRPWYFVVWIEEKPTAVSPSASPNGPPDFIAVLGQVSPRSSQSCRSARYR